MFLYLLKVDLFLGTHLCKQQNQQNENKMVVSNNRFDAMSLQAASRTKHKDTGIKRRRKYSPRRKLKARCPKRSSRRRKKKDYEKLGVVASMARRTASSDSQTLLAGPRGSDLGAQLKPTDQVPSRGESEPSCRRGRYCPFTTFGGDLSHAPTESGAAA